MVEPNAVGGDVLATPNPIFSGASAAPEQPGTSMPVAPANATPAAPAAPDVPNQPTDLADQFSQVFIKHLADRQPPPPAGSVAAQKQQQATIGDAMRAKGGGLLTALTQGLGDAANAGQNGSGWLSGISKTLANRGARLTDEARYADAQARQKQNDEILQHESAARLIRLNQDIQTKSEDLRHASLTDSQNFVNAYDQAGYHVDKGISQQELQKRVAADPDFWVNHSGGKTQEVPLLGADGQPQKDSQGNTIYNPSYSIVDLRTAPPDSGAIKVTSSIRDYYKKNLGIDYPVDTPLTPQVFANLTAKSHQVADMTRIIEKDNEEDFNDAMRDQLRPDFQNSSVIAAVNKYSGRPLKGVAEFRANADQHVAALTTQIQQLQAANPNDPKVADLQKQLSDAKTADDALNRVQQYGFNEKAQDRELTAQREDEKVRHDQQQEKIQQQREDYRAQVADQKSKLDANGKAGAGELQKATDKYSDFLFTSNSAKSSIQNAKNGDELANSLGPLQTALLVTSANGVHRINSVEVDSAGPKVGSLGRRIDAELQKAGTGKLPAATLQEMSQLVDLYQQAKYESYVRNAAYTAKLRGMNPAETPVMDKNGNVATLADAMAGLSPTAGQAAPSASTSNTSTSAPAPKIQRPQGVSQNAVLMQAPGGAPHWIEPNNLAAAQQAGAKQVQ